MMDFLQAYHLTPDINTLLLLCMLFWLNKMDARITCIEQFLMEHGFDRRRARHNT